MTVMPLEWVLGRDTISLELYLEAITLRHLEMIHTMGTQGYVDFIIEEMHS